MRTSEHSIQKVDNMPKKSRSGNHPNPAIRLSSFGLRATQLCASSFDDPTTILGELDQLTDGLKPSSFLPILLGAFASLSEAQRTALNGPISEWLQQHGHVELLRSLEDRHIFKEPTRSVVRALLAMCGIDLAPVVVANPADLFLAAFELGGTSQDSPTIFWYEDERHRRVCRASFLVDFEPPWEGALKDIAFTYHRNLNEAIENYRMVWQFSGFEPRPINAATAAQRVWKAFRQNQAQGIRLPADFIMVQSKVMPFVTALQVNDETVPLEAAEIDAMVNTGRSPESIRREEDLLGYQTRMPDGRVIRIIRPPED